MKKIDMLRELDALLEKKGMAKIDCGNGKVAVNDNKNTIQEAIDCLSASDEEMQDYLTVFKLKYPNSYKRIVENGNWLLHSFNRFYVYSTAKMIIGG
jgi:hypothetical protein